MQKYGSIVKNCLGGYLPVDKAFAKFNGTGNRGKDFVFSVPKYPDRAAGFRPAKKISGKRL